MVRLGTMNLGIAQGMLAGDLFTNKLKRTILLVIHRAVNGAHGEHLLDMFFGCEFSGHKQGPRDVAEVLLEGRFVSSVLLTYLAA